MRIFFASDATPNPLLRSNIWRNNLYSALTDLGHQVIEFRYDWGETFRNLDPADPVQKRFIEQNRPRVTAELLRQVKAAHEQEPLNLFFSYFYDACVQPEAIDKIKNLGVVTINWYCNGSYQLSLVHEISPHYDWCLVPEKFRLPDYVKLGARPLYCQEAANPRFYKPYPAKPEFDATFVGQKYGDRPDLIAKLLKAGVDVRVWGVGWRNRKSEGHLLKRAERSVRRWIRRTRDAITEIPLELCGEPLTDEELVRMFSRSKINLGFSTCGSTHTSGARIVQIRLRDFEVPMSGGFYLVEYMDELAEFFEIGREIACYHDAEDLVEKVKYYLQHDNEREAIARAGRERCLRDHTWQRRFQTVFRTIGLVQ